MTISELSTSTGVASAPDSLAALARVAAALQGTTKRLAKRAILAEYLRGLPDEALPLAVTFLSGRPFPRSDDRKLSVGGAAFNSAILAARPDVSEKGLYDAWLRHSDAFENIQKSPRHKSGYALRFPRFVRIRTDKTPDQINTLADVVRMYGQLHGEEPGSAK